MFHSMSEQKLLKTLKIKNELGFNLGSRQRLVTRPQTKTLVLDSPQKTPPPKPERGCKIVIKLPRRAQQSSEIKELVAKKFHGTRMPTAYTYY